MTRVTHEVWVGEVSMDGGDDPLAQQRVQLVAGGRVVARQQTEQAAHVYTRRRRAATHVVVQQVTDQALHRMEADGRG